MNLLAAERRRIQLDQTSWIEHTPGWLGPDQAEELLAKLIANAAWEQRDRWLASRRVIEPRLTAEYTDLADAPTPRSAKQPAPSPPSTRSRTTARGSTSTGTIALAPHVTLCDRSRRSVDDPYPPICTPGPGWLAGYRCGAELGILRVQGRADAGRLDYIMGPPLHGAAVVVAEKQASGSGQARPRRRCRGPSRAPGRMRRARADPAPAVCRGACGQARPRWPQPGPGRVSCSLAPAPARRARTSPMAGSRVAGSGSGRWAWIW